MEPTQRKSQPPNGGNETDDVTGAPPPHLCQRPLAFSYLNQWIPLSSVARLSFLLHFPRPKMDTAFSKCQVTVRPGPRRQAMLRWFPFSRVGVCPGPACSLTSVFCSPSLRLLSSSPGTTVAPRRPADAWNPWSGTLCYSTFSSVSPLVFCLG